MTKLYFRLINDMETNYSNGEIVNESIYCI